MNNLLGGESTFGDKSNVQLHCRVRRSAPYQKKNALSYMTILQCSFKLYLTPIPRVNPP